MVQIVIEKDVGFNQIVQFLSCGIYIPRAPFIWIHFVRKHGFEPWPSVSNRGITIGDDALES